MFTHTKSKQMKIKSIWGVTEILPTLLGDMPFLAYFGPKTSKKNYLAHAGGVFFICPGWGTSGLVKKTKNGHKKRSNKKVWALTTPKIESWPLKANQTLHTFRRYLLIQQECCHSFSLFLAVRGEWLGDRLSGTVHGGAAFDGDRWFFLWDSLSLL